MSGRTAAPRWAVLSWGLLAKFDAAAGGWGHVGITSIGASGLACAVTRHIGIRANVEGTFRGWSMPWARGQPKPTGRMGDRLVR